jgi:hypothetical protein
MMSEKELRFSGRFSLITRLALQGSRKPPVENPKVELGRRYSCCLSSARRDCRGGSIQVVKTGSAYDKGSLEY